MRVRRREASIALSVSGMTCASCAAHDASRAGGDARRARGRGRRAARPRDGRLRPRPRRPAALADAVREAGYEAEAPVPPSAIGASVNAPDALAVLDRARICAGGRGSTTSSRAAPPAA